MQGFSEDEFNDFDLPSIFGQEEFSLPPIVDQVPDSSSQVTRSSPPTKSVPLPPPALELEPLVNLEDVRDYFKCTVCLELKMPLMFCNSCARFIGCAMCIGELSQCPLCRAKFEVTCTNCDHKENTLPTPIKIPGLQDIFSKKGFLSL